MYLNVTHNLNTILIHVKRYIFGIGLLACLFHFWIYVLWFVADSKSTMAAENNNNNNNHTDKETTQKIKIHTCGGINKRRNRKKQINNIGPVWKPFDF